MKAIGLTSIAILCLLLGIAAPAHAWQEQHEQQADRKDKPAHQDEKKAQQAKPAQHEGETARPQGRNAKQEQRSDPQQNKDAKQEEKKAPQHQQQPERQAKSGQQAQHAAGNHGGRIPDDRYRANFGREHRFHVTQSDYSRNHRFQYGGYWFGFVDPWPSNWLYTQDVYVVDINGVYYLCNPMYPGVNITLSVGL
ncbi:MAG TPA: hypothetical protein VMH03_08375 [Terriglobales bacterium]|nr:hypothetical protein [Terriglobales bacterium]